MDIRADSGGTCTGGTNGTDGTDGTDPGSPEDAEQRYPDGSKAATSDTGAAARP
jgi:hypothetical protein